MRGTTLFPEFLPTLDILNADGRFLFRGLLPGSNSCPPQISFTTDILSSSAAAEPCPVHHISYIIVFLNLFVNSLLHQNRDI